MLRARLYDAKSDDREVEVRGDEVRGLTDEQLLWVDLDERDDAALTDLGEALALEPQILSNLRTDSHRPRLVRFDERILITLGALETAQHEVERRELDVVVGRNTVVTVHDGPVSALSDFEDQLGGETRLGALDAGAFMAALVDSVLAAYFAEVERIERDIDALDQVALRFNSGDQFLDAVVHLRLRIATVRRALTPNREALSPLVRPDFEVRQELGSIWPGIVERLERAIEGVEKARELLVGSLDIYLGRAAQKSNDVMKLLTLVSAVALPSIVLAGIMGMNFKLPFFENSDNFWVVIGSMVVLALVILGFARWRRWI